MLAGKGSRIESEAKHLRLINHINQPTFITAFYVALKKSEFCFF